MNTSGGLAELRTNQEALDEVRKIHEIAVLEMGRPVGCKTLLKCMEDALGSDFYGSIYDVSYGSYKRIIESDFITPLIENRKDIVKSKISVDRVKIKAAAERTWTSAERFISYEFETLRDFVNELLNSTRNEDRHKYFEIDHATSLKEGGSDAHHPRNFQLLTQLHNVKKNASSQTRMTWDEQVSYLMKVIECDEFLMQCVYDKDILELKLKSFEPFYNYDFS